MSKKPYKFTKLSETKCGNPDCGKLLKKNVVERKPKDNLLICWECTVKITRNMNLSVYKKYRALRAKIRAEGGDPKAARAVTFRREND